MRLVEICNEYFNPNHVTRVVDWTDQATEDVASMIYMVDGSKWVVEMDIKVLVKKLVGRKNSKKEKEIENYKIIEKIIDYTNKRCSTSFQPDSKLTVRHINEWLKLGFKVFDFQLVTAWCHKQWWNDPYMKKFIRPSTMFGPKFEEYLGMAKVKMNQSVEDKKREATRYDTLEKAKVLTPEEKEKSRLARIKVSKMLKDKHIVR